MERAASGTSVVATSPSNTNPNPWCEPCDEEKPHFYTPSHDAFRARVRSFVEEHMMPYVDDWEESGTYPADLAARAHRAGVYASMYPREFGGTPPEGCDAFHDLILHDELSRCNSGGLVASAFFAFGIGLPPILAAGSPALKDQVVPGVLSGVKQLALAVSEPWAGSDVANLRTTARRAGDYYVVSGAKKWITNGIKADYFTAAVRTGGPGAKGVSLLVIPATLKGISRRRMKTQGWLASNTAYIEFNDVNVPAANLVGKEGHGFPLIMHNFNHERWAIAAQANRYSRTLLNEALQYALSRQTFGARLIDHQSLRHKIAEMARQVEATHAYLEGVTLRFRDSPSDQKGLGRDCALLKVQATKTFEYCAREASQIFGGNAYLREGRGKIVERLYREVRVAAIGGGSEEVMMDLAMRGVASKL